MTGPVKAGMGFIYAWRAFVLVRDPQRGGRWHLASPIAGSLTFLGEGDNEFYKMDATAPSACKHLEKFNKLEEQAAHPETNAWWVSLSNGLRSSNLLAPYRDLNHLMQAYATACEFDTHGPAPASNCTCGYYSYKYLEHLLSEYDISNFNAIGIVKLHGRVIRHSMGYRSEYLVPHKIWIPETALSIVSPPWFYERQRKKMLTEVVNDIADEYNCEVTLAARPFAAPVLDAYLDAAQYPPLVEIPVDELPTKYKEGDSCG